MDIHTNSLGAWGSCKRWSLGEEVHRAGRWHVDLVVVTQLHFQRCWLGRKPDLALSQGDIRGHSLILGQGSTNGCRGQEALHNKHSHLPFHASFWIFFCRLKPGQDLRYKSLKRKKKNVSDCSNCNHCRSALRKKRGIQYNQREEVCVILCCWLCFFWMFIPCLSFSIFNKIWETSCQLSQETSYDLTRKHDIIHVYTHWSVMLLDTPGLQAPGQADAALTGADRVTVQTVVD